MKKNKLNRLSGKKAKTQTKRGFRRLNRMELCSLTRKQKAPLVVESKLNPFMWGYLFNVK